jgi:L-lactate utilization protein LutB
MEIIYNCHMCGGCDTSCKYSMDMEVIEPINEIRIEAVSRATPIPPWTRSSITCARTAPLCPAPKPREAMGQWHES